MMVHVFEIPILLALLCFKYTNGLRILTEASNGKNQYIEDLNNLGLDPQKTHSVTFQVAACSDVYVVLYNHVYWSYSGITQQYEFVIGGWENTKSRLVVKNGNVNDTFAHPRPPLDCCSFKAFWVSWENGNFRSGYGFNVGESIFYDIPNAGLNNVYKVGIYTGWGHRGVWALTLDNSPLKPSDYNIAGYLHCDKGTVAYSIPSYPATSESVHQTSSENTYPTSSETVPLTSSQIGDQKSSEAEYLATSQTVSLMSSESALLTQSENAILTSSDTVYMTSSESALLTQSETAILTSSDTVSLTSSESALLTQSETANLTSSETVYMTSSESAYLTLSETGYLTSSEIAYGSSSGTDCAVLKNCNTGHFTPSASWNGSLTTTKIKSMPSSSELTSLMSSNLMTSMISLPSQDTTHVTSDVTLMTSAPISMTPMLDQSDQGILFTKQMTTASSIQDVTSSKDVASSNSSPFTPATTTPLINCTCRPCDGNAKSNKSLSEKIESIRIKLTLVKYNLSAVRRRLTSANDVRQSSQYMGAFGATILALVFGLIIMTDIQRVLAFLMDRKKDVREIILTKTDPDTTDC